MQVGFHGTLRQQFNMTLIGIIALIVLVIARAYGPAREKRPAGEGNRFAQLSEDKQKSETPAPPKNAS